MSQEEKGALLSHGAGKTSLFQNTDSRNDYQGETGQIKVGQNP